MNEIWFWQATISPHMVDLIVQLSKFGNKIKLIYEDGPAIDRVKLGWPNITSLPNINLLRLDKTEAQLKGIINSAPKNSVHICQGMRSNGYIAKVQYILIGNNIKFWIMMEQPSLSKYNYLLKRLLYLYALKKNENFIEGFLAIGSRAKGFLISLGVIPGKIYEFGYFLPEISVAEPSLHKTNRNVFRFIFVGNLIPRKNLKLLIKVLLNRNVFHRNFELWIVGNGSSMDKLRRNSLRIFRDRIRWFGPLPMGDIPQIIHQADCLVLPSKHDGWGAVIPEALMAGTRVICSDMCGASLLLDSANIFQAGNEYQLSRLVLHQLNLDTVSSQERAERAFKANMVLSGRAGAAYLLEILEHYYYSRQREQPYPPWKRISKSSQDYFLKGLT